MKSPTSAWIDPRATVPALVVADGRTGFGWRSDGRPTGLLGLPGRGARVAPSQLRETSGPTAPPSDLRGRWSVRGNRTAQKLELSARRRFGRATLTIQGTAEAVDGPWSWVWTVDRVGQPPSTGSAPARTDWPDVCRAALRDVYDLEKRSCARENLTRRGQSTATAAGLGKAPTMPAGPARGELAAAPAPAPKPAPVKAAPAPAPRRAGRAKQAGLFGA